MANKIVMNWDGLVELSNTVNDKVCMPHAKKAMGKLDASEYEIVEHDRTDKKSWARTRIIGKTAKASRKEAKHGTLARAVGGQ